MRNFTLLILAVLYVIPALAQRKCGTEEAMQQLIASNPALQKVRERKEARLQEMTRSVKQSRAQMRTIYPTVTIPVVVHIVMRNPSQVTDEQVQSQIDALNRDYAAAAPDISNIPAAWQPLLGQSNIQFCLAQRTPDDNPTNGINRVTTTRTSFSSANSAAAVKHAATGGADVWNSDNYLNIWVCNLAENYLGIATFPQGYPADEQGVVITYTAFGTTGSAVSPYNVGRTTVHEVGHFFSLRHIWGDESGCAADDGIDDTPLQGNYTYNCPPFPLTDRCTVDSPGIMFNNFMDYSDDACMLLFTSDQVDRMRLTLENDRSSLMFSEACLPLNLQENDASIMNILTPYNQICENNILPRVVLKNQGKNPLTSVKIYYVVDEGTTLSYDWTGNLAALKSDTVDLASSVPGEGLHLLKVYTGSPNNNPIDGEPSNDTAWSPFQYYADATFPLLEGFEGNTFPPAGWEIKNYDNSYSWELSSDAAKSGTKSIVIHNLAYNTNEAVDDMLSPVFDPTGKDSVFLFFDVAAAAYSSLNGTNTTWDSLQILTTSDCGNTFDSLYKKGGSSLLTRRVPVTTEFVPTASEWRRDSINLTPIIKKGPFRVVFRNISNAENNIYLDNINIVTKNTLPYLKEKGLVIGPVPTSNQLYITFLEIPNDLEWIGIYNTLGQLVAKQPGSSINNSNRFIFDLVNEPNGIYFVKLIYRNNVKTIKITKVN
ncbi:M43 family zinc metalloprotease [Chitinophaga pinensis]|uniref:T9SS type A sorting domain-containing protein n=1 Tax=Chitinophaga pinensis TaxID=79329 RepID=A0A5C6LRY1_9BACT|nr:M43 family zinc metalloprotease [Chitinophaga pinensis]TWV99376.1 T9SS type A sorting domain-containing protein [Chitinophaga pinensis]